MTEILGSKVELRHAALRKHQWKKPFVPSASPVADVLLYVIHV